MGFYLNKKTIRMNFVRLAPKGFTKSTRPSAFLKSVLQNGVGRNVVQMKRASLKFCEHSHHSRYVRKFVEQNLIDFAEKHPSVAIYVIPETDMEPVIRVEYLNGRVENRYLDRLDNEEIVELLETYVKRSGVELLQIKKPFHTDCPSIQGQWNPFTNKKDYDINKEEVTIRKIWTFLKTRVLSILSAILGIAG